MTRAYVTVLVRGDAYAPGVEALGYSLRASHSDARRVVLATDDVPGATLGRLEGQGWQIQRVKPVHQPVTEHLFPRFASTFTKLRAFEQVAFDKIVLLDADTVVLRNIDDLFDRPAIAAAPDFFMPDHFNSGVMVIEPSRALFHALETALRSAPTYDGGDQGFLNSFWADWWEMPAAHRLRGVYNLHQYVFQFLCGQPLLRRQFLDEVRVVHYTAQKPWRDFTVMGGSQTWWKVFAGIHPEQNTAWRRRLHALQDWSFESLVAALSS